MQTTIIIYLIGAVLALYMVLSIIKSEKDFLNHSKPDSAGTIAIVAVLFTLCSWAMVLLCLFPFIALKRHK